VFGYRIIKWIDIGLFEDDQLFAVWEDDDVLALIKRLGMVVK
jgi:hypothetical protein